MTIGDKHNESANEPATQAEKVVSLAKELYRFGQTPKHEPFAVKIDGSNVALWLNGSGGALKDAIAFAYRAQHNGVMNSTAFTDALCALRGEALTMQPESVSIRVGRSGGSVVLDLGRIDGSAALIGHGGGGWVVVPRSKILFQRTALTGELPMPTHGGSLEQLRELLNVTPETWPVLLAWLVAALIPDMPHPILMLGGQQGTGKTTAARYICGVFDPSDAPIRSQPRDPEAWSMSVANSWATVIDNVSTIPEWWSDALCKAVTGDGFVRRMLYTNNEVSVLSFKRVIALTSIDAGALRGDLAERLLLVDLDPIPEDKRKSELDLDKAYRAVHSSILGALLDLAGKVLYQLPKVQLTQLPRMADFAKVLAAVDAVLGTTSLALYLDQSKRIACDVLDADPVGTAIVNWMSRRGELWSGSASQLMDEIKPDDPDRSWPRSPRGFGSRLRRLMPALALQGVIVTPPHRNDRKRDFVVQPIAQTARQPENAIGGEESSSSGRAVETTTAHPPIDSPSEDVGLFDGDADSGRSGGSGCRLHTNVYGNEWGES